MTRRVITTLAAAALLAGCASFEKKAPPEPQSAPPEEPVSEPVPAEPAKPAEEVAKPPDSAKPPVPPRQELPGSWTSVSATGPGSAPVRRVEMEFGADGAWCGSMLLEIDGKKRFETLAGTWTAADGRIVVKLSDTRERKWSVSWDGATLVLRDGDAELRLERTLKGR
ncbi:MAG: hypothetical protein K8T20_02575 [Planctomycetes bacterium]|nr:hypothetical protein [Planctomycetota bacterium]